MKNLIFIFIIFLFPNINYCQEYADSVAIVSYNRIDNGFTYVTTSDDGIDYYVKVEKKLELFNELISVDYWIKYNNPINTTKTKQGKYVKSGGGFTLAFMFTSCSSKTYKTEEIIKYDKTGKVIYNEKIHDPEWNISPNSVIEEIYRLVCRKY